jgi:hypothetical protein
MDLPEWASLGSLEQLFPVLIPLALSDTTISPIGAPFSGNQFFGVNQGRLQSRDGQSWLHLDASVTQRVISIPLSDGPKFDPDWIYTDSAIDRAVNAPLLHSGSDIQVEIRNRDRWTPSITLALCRITVPMAPLELPSTMILTTYTKTMALRDKFIGIFFELKEQQNETTWGSLNWDSLEISSDFTVALSRYNLSIPDRPGNLHEKNDVHEFLSILSGKGWLLDLHGDPYEGGGRTEVVHMAQERVRSLFASQPVNFLLHAGPGDFGLSSELVTGLGSPNDALILARWSVLGTQIARGNIPLFIAPWDAYMAADADINTYTDVNEWLST